MRFMLSGSSMSNIIVMGVMLAFLVRMFAGRKFWSDMVKMCMNTG